MTPTKPYRSSAFVLLLFFSTMFRAAGSQEHGWPIEPVNEDHPLASTLGEILVLPTGGAYQHEGIDILATAFDGQFPPFAVVTVAGHVDELLMNQNSLRNFVRIVDATGKRRYIYGHLESTRLAPQLKLQFLNGRAMQAGERIAQITNLYPCGFDHLHYEVHRINDDTTISALNPLSSITPKPDNDHPTIVNIFLAQHHDDVRWSEIELSEVPGVCTEVSGQLDIVVEVQDRDDAGSTLKGASNVGVYDLRWRACRLEATNCEWNETHIFDQIPADWTVQDNESTTSHFSVTSPWRSTFNMCADDAGNRSFMIPTSHTQSASWNTVARRNGDYNVSVEAKDLAGNVSERTLCVHVKN